jgi:hypothetical protein
VTGSYVYSKTLDDGSEVFASGNTPTSYSANLAPGGRSQDWGNSVYDHRQYASINYVWTPGGLHSNNKGADAFLSGVTRHWTISGTTRFQSGSYSTVNFSGLDSNGDGTTSNDRPILSNLNASMDSAGIDGYYCSWLNGHTCNGTVPATIYTVPGTYYDVYANNTTGAITPIDPSKVRWLIPHGAQFLHQEIGRNSIANPGTVYNDIALEKAIPTSLLHLDKGRFVFRAEAQDFANHNNVGQFNINLQYVGTSSFQNVSNAREANNRAVRFWVKYTF